MDALLYFDFYASKPTLFIKRQSSSRTYIGSILSLITTIVLVILFVFILFCFMYDTGLTVLYEKTSKGLGNLDLNLSKNIFFFRLNDKNGQRINPKILKTYPYLTISTSEGTEHILLNQSFCDVNKLINEDPEYKQLINFDISTYNCVTRMDGKDAVLQRRNSPFKNSYINLFVAKCQNDTKNNITDCVSEEEINKYIEKNSIYVSLFLESAAIDHHNYSYPLTKKYYQNSMSFPKDFIFSYTFFWRKIEYYTRNSLILFNYLFQSSTFFLDATIKDKEIYSTNSNFYINKTIGRMQFLITVEYADSYIRKYITLIDSLTILMTGFNIITKLCWILNYLFTKSYIYCTIFEPIIKNNSSRNFYESMDTNLNIRNINIFQSPNPSSTKLKLIQNKKGNEITILNLNKKNNSSINKSIINNSIIDTKTNLEMKKNEEIRGILNDIQNDKINSDIGFIDNFIFLFAKIFNSQNKKQLYLRRLEKFLLEELSIDYLFQEFRKIKAIIYKDINKYNYEKKNGTKSTKNHYSLFGSSIKNI